MSEAEALPALLRRLGLVGAGPVRCSPLTGGVSSDILKVEADGAVFAVKRALPKLKVAAEWCVPVERNAYEAAWMEIAARIEPDAVPHVLAQDASSGLFAMDYLDPASHPVWKHQLRDGHADAAFAAEVGRRIAAIHAATAGDMAAAARFATDHIFHAIRLEPYLEATAHRHPAVKDRLMVLSRATLATHVALVHGDVSPKNILAGPRGPVFLDAECAWYGDPAFDVAFCLNHMLLKCLWAPRAATGFLACFDALAASWLKGVRWESPRAAEARAAALLPALFLARIDGKSPVEYVTDERQRDLVRTTALPLIAAPPPRLATIRDAWAVRLDL